MSEGIPTITSNSTLLWHVWEADRTKWCTGLCVATLIIISSRGSQGQRLQTQASNWKSNGWKMMVTNRKCYNKYVVRVFPPFRLLERCKTWCWIWAEKTNQLRKKRFFLDSCFPLKWNLIWAIHICQTFPWCWGWFVFPSATLSLIFTCDDKCHSMCSNTQVSEVVHIFCSLWSLKSIRNRFMI